MPLPEHLRALAAVYADPSAAGSPLALRVRAALPHLPFTVLDQGQSPPRDQPGQIVHITSHKGRFLRPCPAAKRYRCCGYQIVHTGEGCPLDCSYCILKAYLKHRTLRVFANQETMYRDLARRFGQDQARPFRVGTGQFADSLALEPLTGQARDLVSFLGDFDNVTLELKSKVVDLTWMSAAVRPDRVLPAWSVNAPDITAGQEPGAASLPERLAAARQCAEAGFRVCLHFDPVIYYPGWEQGYARTVEMIRDYLRPRDVAYLSLGSLRFLPELGQAISANPLYAHGEYVGGLDGKRRLLRPLRVEQLRCLAGLLISAGFGPAIYLCMESDTVWREVLGRVPIGPDNLGRFLTARAFADG